MTASSTPSLFSSCPGLLPAARARRWPGLTLRLEVTVYQHGPGPWPTVLGFVSPSFRFTPTMRCNAECSDAAIEGAVAAHCCYAFVADAKAQWLASFMPPSKFPSPLFLDLAPYTCGYAEGCLSTEIPYRLERADMSSCSERIGVEGSVGERCARDVSAGLCLGLRHMVPGAEFAYCAVAGVCNRAVA